MYVKNKIRLAASCVLVAFAICAAESKNMSLSQARGKIGEAIANQAVMAETVKSLSAEDQVSFLSAVNAAIAKNPGSKEEKAALFLKSNVAALKAAKGSKGNMKSLLAEVFASAETYALCAISEYFGDKLFNKSADPTKTFSDEAFAKIARSTIDAVAKRCANLNDGSVRTAFCIIMFMRASGGTSEELMNSLLSALPASDREKASKEWLPSALGIGGKEKTYEPMLAESDSESQPDIDIVIQLSSIQTHELVLSSLASGALSGADGINTQAVSYQTPLEVGQDISEPRPYREADQDISEPMPYQGQRF